MYRLINAFFRCFIILLPIPVHDLLWLGDRFEEMSAFHLCGRSRQFCCKRVRKGVRGQEALLKTLSVPSNIWSCGVKRFWSVLQAVDWHLCSPFMFQTLQKSFRFNKVEAVIPPNGKLLLSEDWHKSGIDSISLDSPIVQLSSSGRESSLVPSKSGANRIINSILETNPKERCESCNLKQANLVQAAECEQMTKAYLNSVVSQGLELDQTMEEHLLTVLQDGGESRALYVVDECQPGEDLSTLCGYLGGLIPPIAAGSFPPAEGSRWVPLQPIDETENLSVEWPNLDLSERIPVELNFGFGTFPGIDCCDLRQIIRSTEKVIGEAGNCSEDDFTRQSKKSGAATSGGENDVDELDQDWKPPEADLIQKLIVQIEYYLSDENLEKDAFLLKHVRRNKMGFVSVKLLTSFKKVKHLTRDWRTTAYALRYSNLLELNEDNRKIRRKMPVPVFPSENLPSKMLLVYDLHCIPELQFHCLGKEQENGGMQEKIMEQLLKSFGAFGVISSIRILKPGRDIPSDIKRFSSRYSQVGTKDCAIVEFEEVEAAIKAHEAFNIESDADDGLKVVLIGMKPPKKKIQKDRSKDDESKNLRKNKSLNKRVEELQFTGDESTAYSSSEPDSNPNSPMVGRKIQSSNKLSPSAYPNNHLSPNASPRNSPWSSPCGQRKGVKQSPLADSMSPEFSRKCTEYSSDSSITPSSSPWVQRRRQAQTVTQEKSPSCSPMLGRKIQNADGLPPGVLRLPRGPDGTKGFHNGAERSKSAQCS
ncbi:hypothetical protein GDO86_006240 [Hymenochirus boettgeri]|uniref:La-related protein 6 n=1 Tax=Hymenochirus boettgeri TaxID=247094 RepID=A0A8T2J5A8_9PIPI|nr:hypothetical protein GDO86_006240 [Hymenochirus boettgeri]